MKGVSALTKKVVMEGNIAVCEAALRAGCKFYAGYPITPQSSITEYLSHEMQKHGGDFVQAESEVAAINMIAGASAGGARAMTATSGPGFSLMAEGMSFISASRFPAVIVDVQRSGAGGGHILASQSDYNYATKTLGHGGLKAFTVGPESAQEAVDWTYRAFDIADEYRCAVIVLTDGMLGQMLEPVELPEPKKDIPARDYIASGCEGRERRLVLDFTFDNLKLESWYKAAAAMYQKWEDELAVAEEYRLDDAEYVIAAWGSSARIAKTAIDELREEGVKVGMLRAVTLHPFPVKQFHALSDQQVKKVLTVEMSDPGQFYYDVDRVLRGRFEHRFFSRSGGVIITPDEIQAAVRSML